MLDLWVAYCPCFETLASLAPQHEVVVFQRVRPHPERVRMFRSCPQNFTAAGLGNTLRGVFGRAGDRMAAIKPNSANCGSWATPCLAEATRRRFVGAVSMGSLLCRCQRLGAQRE